MQSLWMLAASFLFSIMGVCVKLASSHFSIAEIVAWRGLIGMVMIVALVRWQGGSLRTGMAGQHAWRGLVGVTALWLWFLSIARLPLAMAVTLNYMSPVWIAAILLGTAWLKQQRRVAWALPGAIALGFAGVVLLLRPAMQADQTGSALLALGSGMLAALAYLQVRKMGLRGEPEYRVVFYFSLTCAIAGFAGNWLAPLAPLAPAHGAAPASALWLLLAIGLTAASAQMAMTRAYRLGNPLLTANLQYSGIVFSSIWDIVLWHDTLNGSGWLGIGIILISGLIASFYNARSKRPQDTDPIAAE